MATTTQAVISMDSSVVFITPVSGAGAGEGAGVFSLIQAKKVCAAPQGGVLCRFCLESGVVFEGTTGLYEHINCRFNSK